MYTKNIQELESQSIGKLLWHYSFPTIVGTLVNALYNVVDRIFIGQGVGAYAISGLALTFPIMMILGAFGMLVGQGAATHISIALGKKENETANKILGNAFVLTLIVSGSVISLMYLFLNEILIAFGGTAAIIPYAKEYLKIILPWHIVTTFSFSFTNIMRASGFPIKAMLILLTGALLNVVLDPIFIFDFGLGLGIKGAAIATVISKSVSSVWVFLHFFNKRHLVHFQKDYFRINRSIALPIVAIGFAPFCVQVGTSLVNVLMNHTLSRYGGELAIGAFGIITTFSTLIIMAIVGMTNGVQPIIGYNYGAKKYDRVLKTLKYACVVAISLTLIGSLCAQLFAKQIATLFTSDLQLINLTERGMRLAMMMFFVVGFQLVVTNFFQSIGQVKMVIFLSVSRQILFLMPFLLLLPKFFGLDGAWTAHWVADLLSALVAGVVLVVQIKKLKQSHIS